MLFSISVNRFFYFTPIYNKIFLIELFIEGLDKKIFLSKLRGSPHFSQGYQLIYENKAKIAEIKKYLHDVLVNDFSFFEQLNFSKGKFVRIIDDDKAILKTIANCLLLRCYSLQDNGLLKGRMGILIFLFHYARHTNNETIKELADELLSDLWMSISVNLSYNFQSGLAGIGWGISYLFNNFFIEGNINEMLEEIDQKIKEIDIKKLNNLTLGSGLGGVVHYVISRIYTIDYFSLENVFEQEFLESIYQKSKEIIHTLNPDTDCIDVFIKYVMHYEGNIMLDSPITYDFIYISYPENYDIETMSLGLDGNAGFGLNILFEKERLYRLKQ